MGAIIKVLMWAFVAVFLLVAFIRGMMDTGPTPEELEQQRIWREAKERLDQETDDLLRLGRELQLRDEMERQRKKRGF